MNKVLILLSTYNGSKYLEEQLNSLKNQSDLVCDILVRDDGSNDSTCEILKKWNDNGDLNYILGKNIGSVNSFIELIGIASLEYDYYAFCDQDDYWECNKVSCAIGKISSVDKTQPALYYSGQKLVDEKLNFISHHLIDDKRSSKACFIFNQMAGCTAVFNNKLLQILKLYKPENIITHDTWCYRVCAVFNGKIFVEKTGHILYRQHGSNVVGLNNGIMGKIKRGKTYLIKYRPSIYAIEILKGYGNMISEEWTEYLKDICSAHNNLKSKIKLIIDKHIVFNSFYLRMIFILKVILGKI